METPVEADEVTPVDEKRITIMGPTSSGKTHLLATILHTQRCTEDIVGGGANIVYAAFKFPDLAARDDFNAVRNKWHDHYQLIQKGQPSEPTFGSVSIQVNMTWCSGNPTASGGTKSAWPWQTSKPGTAAETKENSEVFMLTDGRGGDVGVFVSPEASNEEADLETHSRIDAYRQAMRDSKALILCLPVSGAEIINAELGQLKLELGQLIDHGPGHLERIAFCLTKYEAAFLDFGQLAGQVALDRELARKKLRIAGYRDLYSILWQLAHPARGRKRIDVCMFPVSVFGFVGGSGAPNFYPDKNVYGLMTRELMEEDRSAGEQLDLARHFPFAITGDISRTLWQPFNIAPPLFFAGTGIRTGPLFLDIEECFDRGRS